MRRFLLMAVAIALAICTPVLAQETAAPAPQDVPVTPDTDVTSGGFTYRLGLGYMFHLSDRQDYAFYDDQFRDDETFAWWRLRPRFAATSKRIDIVVEGQDTHATGHEFGARKAWLDILNAYVDVKDMRGWSVKAGRQQGDLEVIGRMVRQPDFAAILRTFDVAEVSWQNKSTDLRGVVFKPVENLPAQFNRQKPGELLWTVFGRRTLGARAALQSYVVARHEREVLSEDAVPGSGAVYAWHLQAEGPTPSPAIRWTAETILERGHYSTDDVRAWGVLLRSDITLTRNSTMDVRYTVTSPDVARGDGVRGQFDTFYGAASYFGSLGQVRGINIRQFSAGGVVRLRPKLTLNWRYFNSHLNDRRDQWYGAVTPNHFRADARSSFLGHELNALFSYQATPRMMIRAGYFQFLRGGYMPDGGGHPREARLQIIGGF